MIISYDRRKATTMRLAAVRNENNFKLRPIEANFINKILCISVIKANNVPCAVYGG